MENKKIIIFDTTLRDGEQSPGASMNVEEKLIMAGQLRRLNVDVIEAGFAASSPGDFESVRRIAQEIRGPIIASLARAVKGDIEKAGEALKPLKAIQVYMFKTFISYITYHKKRNKDKQNNKEGTCMYIEFNGYKHCAYHHHCRRRNG